MAVSERTPANIDWKYQGTKALLVGTIAMMGLIALAYVILLPEVVAATLALALAMVAVCTIFGAVILALWGLV